MKFNGINHLAMVTGDMDKTIHFWRDLLGMRLAAGLGRPGYRHYFFEISKTDLLAFFEWSDVDPVDERDHGYPQKGPVIFDHVSFGVDTEDDLWALKGRLEAAGFQVSAAINHGFIISIYTWDPNGIPIEFSYNVPEVDIRQDPQMADKVPTRAAREGPDPVENRWPTARAFPQEKRKIYPGAGSELFHGTKNNS